MHPDDVILSEAKDLGILSWKGNAMTLRCAQGDRPIMARVLAFLGISLLIGVVSAQAQTPPATPDPVQSPVATPPTPHRFWDATNLTLFAGVAASRALDYNSTQHFRRNGVNEWLLTNRIVDNKPLFIGIEVGAAAASIGASYWAHRSGHHRLERWISAIHIGVGVGGSIRNYTLRGNSPAASP